MSGFSEYPRAATWLTTVLTTPPITGLTGGVHEHPGPQGSVYPMVTFQQQSEVDLSVINAHRVWAEFLILVRVIGQTASTVSLEAIADEIDARLHRVSGTTTDAQVISSVRESSFHMAEAVQGVEYRHLGGLYQLLVQPTHP